MWNQQSSPRSSSRVGCSGDFGQTSLGNPSRGAVTTEFIFSFIIASGLSIVLFALSYTLLVVETLQYVSFAVARSHLAGNLTPQKQIEAGQKKYQALTQSDGAIATIFKSSWFEIGTQDEIQFRQGVSAEGTGGARDFSADLGGGGINPHMRFQGVSLRFLPKILNFRIMGLGSTNPEEDPSTFETRINTMLIREVSQSECREFFKQRSAADVWRPIVENSNLTIVPSDFSLVEDNGC